MQSQIHIHHKHHNLFILYSFITLISDHEVVSAVQ